jgi:hypothetical protein
MPNRIEFFDQINNLINQIPEMESFTFILEDWNNGLIVEENKNGNTIKNDINNLFKQFGSLFVFRLFNEQWELLWDGYNGRLIKITDDSSTKESNVFLDLETDSNRYPGIKNLVSNNYSKIILQKVVSNDEDREYFKFKKLI